MVTEWLYLNDIWIIQENTDGITVKIHKSKVQMFKDYIKGIEKTFNVEFEYLNFKKMWFLNVNSYLAIDEYGGIKQKGDFVTKPVLGDSVNELIIPKLLVDYFTKGIDIEKAIKEESDIFLFCLSKKIDKNYQVYWNNVRQQNLNRFFVSKKGSFLYKKKENKNLENVLKGNPVMLYNKASGEDARTMGIDYTYYINKIKEVIHKFEPTQLSLSFF